MRYLINILIGLGSSLGGFGASRPYSVPRRGDWAKDSRNLAKDFRAIGLHKTVGSSKKNASGGSK